MPVMVNAGKLYEIKPQSIVYLFSGGKDSSATLILTRDAVKQYVDDTRAKAYILYIYVTGNTHPLNAYCAYTIGKWHREHYGFKFVAMARNRLFQEYIQRYGLQIGPKRWCFLEFKEHLIREFMRKLPRPILMIDGMKPSDSKHRSRIVTAEYQYIESRGGYWSWHPLFNIVDDGEVFDILRRHEEFGCVLELYRVYGDSLNCILCPYKDREKINMYYGTEPASGGIIYGFMKYTMRSKYFLRKYKPAAQNPITYYIGGRD